MRHDFEDQDTDEFVRLDTANDELALESIEAWFWSDDECNGDLVLPDVVCA
jgi:hypothetical protein